MLRLRLTHVLPVTALLVFALQQGALAETRPVAFNVLNASTTLAAPFKAGDNLRLNTLVTEEVGALLQSITFTVGPDVTSYSGEASWEVSSAAGTMPRLVGVNIDLLDAGNAVIASDTFVGLLGGFAHSTFAGNIGPGTYRLLATGTGIRDSSLDVTLSFAAAVPEPEVNALMLAGLLAVGFIARRRSRRS